MSHKITRSHSCLSGRGRSYLLRPHVCVFPLIHTSAHIEIRSATNPARACDIVQQHMYTIHSMALSTLTNVSVCVIYAGWVFVWPTCAHRSETCQSDRYAKQSAHSQSICWLWRWKHKTADTSYAHSQFTIHNSHATHSHRSALPGRIRYFFEHRVRSRNTIPPRHVRKCAHLRTRTLCTKDV